MPEQKTDEMPLRAEDIVEADEIYYESWDENESFAAYAGTGWQSDVSGERILYYVLMEVRWNRLYELCLERWMKAGEWSRADETVWDADIAYEQKTSDRGLYLVGDGTKMLYLVYERKLTDNEIKTVIEHCFAK